MTQAQLDAVNFYLQSDDFKSIYCEFPQKRIMCTFDKNVSLIIKLIKKDICILLKSDKKCIKLLPELFEIICDSKVSVTFLKSFLEQNTLNNKGEEHSFFWKKLKNIDFKILSMSSFYRYS